MNLTSAVRPTSKMDQPPQLAADEYRDKASILCYTKQHMKSCLMEVMWKLKMSLKFGFHRKPEFS